MQIEELEPYIERIPFGGCWVWMAGLGQSGYARVKRNGKAQQVSRLLLGLTDSKQSALHHCDNPACVNPYHLYAGTQKQNIHDKIKRGRQNLPKGERHHNVKLTDQNVQEIRQLYAQGILQKTLAARFGVRQDHISRIVNNHIRK